MAEKQSNTTLFPEFTASTYDEWYDITVKSLKGKPFEKLVKTNYEGFDVQPMYRAEDIADLAHIPTTPGAYPYVRGTKVDGYQSQAWEVAQAINLSDPEDFNQALKHDLDRGQTAIYIGDNLQLNTLDDVKTAFADIDLTQYPIFVKADVNAHEIYNFLETYLGDNMANLTGCIGYDPIHQLAKTGRMSQSIFDAMANLTTQSTLDSIAIRTDIYHDAGANAVQEMSIAMATGVSYMSAMQERGLDINAIASKIRFFMVIGENFFMEVAKFRAIKMMWAQIVREFGGDDEAQKMKLHVRTATRNKTRHDAYVNMLRVTTEAMAGAIGGVDSMQVAPFDEPFGESDMFSRRIARNVQLILQEEVNLTNLIDPAGGSWYVEHLTDQLAQSSWEFFQKIEAQGGMIAVLKNGFIQTEIRAVYDKRQANLAQRKDVIVGTNMYPNLEETMPQERPTRQNSSSSSDSDEVIETTPLKSNRLGEPFEDLRKNAEVFKQKVGNHPQIFLANFGALREYKARMEFTHGFYEVGGFELLDQGGYDTVESAIEATLSSNASALVICSTDDKYADIVPAFTQQLKSQKPDIVVILAGYPKDKIDEYRQAGVDDFIHIRANCYDMNQALQERLGVGS
jgi:methylmalonyl-CoA mutase